MFLTSRDGLLVEYHGRAAKITNFIFTLKNPTKYTRMFYLNTQIQRNWGNENFHVRRGQH